MHRNLYPGILLFCALLFTSCDEESGVINDPVLLQPFLSGMTVFPESFNTDTIPLNGVYLPDDLVPFRVTYTLTVAYPAGLAPTPVNYDVRHPESGRSYASGTLPAGTALTGEIAFSVKRSVTGRMEVSFHSPVDATIGSNTVVQALTIYRSSRAPIISNLSAPDTVQRPPVGQVRLIPLMITAADSDGLDDIAEVFFRNLDSPSDTTRKFFMYDDGDLGGVSGDSASGDGIFSIVIQLPSTTPPGTSRFQYEAIDRSRLSSNLIVRPLVVE